MTLSMEQNIDFDDTHMVVYGYRKSRWRSVLVYILSTLFCGIPFLVFHWCPTWLLYATSYRCSFQIAEKVLVVETYQKKCKTNFIHNIIDKNIADASGLLNEGFEDEFNDEKCSLNSADDLYTPINLEDGTKLNVQHYRCFRHKKQQLVWESGRARWSCLAGLQRGATCAGLHALAARPACHERRMRMLNIYGLNEIKVPVQTVMKLILLEVFNPFYVFQIFTIAVWLAEPYYYYCIAVVLMSTFGVTTSVIQTKKNQETLRATVEARASVRLWGGRGTDARALAPGDVLLATRGPVPCDAVLLTGQAVVNESMLTGESVPVTKTALQRVDKEFDMKEHNFSVLFCGTEIIQTKEYGNEPVKMVVLRTGYSTTKGELVRSILYPIPADFKFDRDSYKFIFILAVIALLGLGYTVALKTYRSLTVGDIILKALDIITIVVPPALPAAMTVGRLYAVARLKTAQVSCLNTRAVNVSGSLDCICFDKTGTLTEDGMDMWGVVTTTNSSPPTLGRPTRDPRALNDLHELKIGMASCHSLTLLDGQIIGDPLDLKMFESTGWDLEEPEYSNADFDMHIRTIVRPKGSANIDVDDVHMPLEVGVVQQYQFVSALQRSSVAVRLRGEDVLRLYCKGAPEMIRTLCRPDTVPVNLEEELFSHTARGFRVVALSSRLLRTHAPLKEMDRAQVECDLEFLGLVIMENRLKPATTGIIRELKEANLHVVMITGDNIHTAVSVAKECGILASGERIVTMTVGAGGGGEQVYCESTQHGVAVGYKISLDRIFDGLDSGCESGTYKQTRVHDGEAPNQDPRYKIVMTGDTWMVVRSRYPLQWSRVLCRGAVFARASPDLKQQLVMDYRELGYYVGMCGDGANDVCGLRAAHAGVSLSGACSVAAPFSSARADVSCVSRLLREGRAALSTSFGVFKFMIAYSLAEFLSVAFLYYFDSNLTDFQFLYIDVALVVNFAFFFGMTEAYTGELCRLPPLTSLLGVVPLLSLVGQMALVILGQYLCYLALTYFPWYVRHTYEGPEANECWENYAIFTVSMFQYITMAIVFSHGAPYRRSVITNGRLMVSVVVMTVISLYITVSPPQWLATFLQLKMPKDSLMSYIVIAVASFNFVLALFFERVIIQYAMENMRMIPNFIKERQVRKTPHLMIKRQLTDMDYLSCDSVMTYDKETKESGFDSNTE